MKNKIIISPQNVEIQWKENEYSTEKIVGKRVEFSKLEWLTKNLINCNEKCGSWSYSLKLELNEKSKNMYKRNYDKIHDHIPWSNEYQYQLNKHI